MDQQPNFDSDVDYMHPNGKPISNEPIDPLPEDHKPDLRSYLTALEEADGHFMYKADPFLGEPPLE